MLSKKIKEKLREKDKEKGQEKGKEKTEKKRIITFDVGSSDDLSTTSGSKMRRRGM